MINKNPCLNNNHGVSVFAINRIPSTSNEERNVENK